MKELQIFNSEQFGQVRTIEKQGKPYFCGKDVATALGYSDTAKAIKLHCKEKGWAFYPVPTEGGEQRIRFIDEGNLYRLITHSKLPEAEKFESWVFDEVLPTLRKTGEYKVKDKPLTEYQRAREKRLNAQLLYNLSKEMEIPEYKQVLQSYCTKELTGLHLIPLPEVNRPTYSAQEIGETLGISKQRVGRIANEHNLKTAEYGKLFYDKSPYSSKEVESFRYYESVIAVIRKILDKEAA